MVETGADPRLSTFHISPLMIIYKLKNAQVQIIPFLAFSKRTVGVQWNPSFLKFPIIQTKPNFPCQTL